MILSRTRWMNRYKTLLTWLRRFRFYGKAVLKGETAKTKVPKRIAHAKRNCLSEEYTRLCKQRCSVVCSYSIRTNTAPLSTVKCKKQTFSSPFVVEISHELFPRNKPPPTTDFSATTRASAYVFVESALLVVAFFVVVLNSRVVRSTVGANISDRDWSRDRFFIQSWPSRDISEI